MTDNARTITVWLASDGAEDLNDDFETLRGGTNAIVKTSAPPNHMGEAKIAFAGDANDVELIRLRAESMGFFYEQ